MTTWDNHANFAVSTVAIPPVPAGSGLLLSVAPGDGALFPAAPFNCVVYPPGGSPTHADAEIVRVTAKAVDAFTILRSQESTGAMQIGAGWVIANALTTKVITDIEAVLNGGSLTARYAATIMGAGDSILANGWSASRPNYALDGRAILAWTTLYSQGKLTLYGNTTTGPAAATGGYTTAQILATEIPIIVTAKPTFCVVIAGANDFAGAVPFATTLANYKAILDTLRSAGITPIVTTLPPRVGPPVNLRALNIWLRNYADAHGCPFADAFASVVDTTTAGLYLAANTSDGGGHPSVLGAKLIGQVIAAAVTPFLTATGPLADNNLVVAGDTIDRWGVSTNNSLLLTDTNLDGTPDGYNVPSSGTCNLTTPASVGNYATLTRAATDVAIRLTTALSGFANGDKCWLAFECYSTVKAVAGGAALYLDQISDGTHVFAGFGKFTEDIPSGSVWSQLFIYDTATIDPRLEIFAYDAVGAKLGFGRGVLLNLTQAGVTAV